MENEVKSTTEVTGSSVGSTAVTELTKKNQMWKQGEKAQSEFFYTNIKSRQMRIL